MSKLFTLAIEANDGNGAEICHVLPDEWTNSWETATTVLLFPMVRLGALKKVTVTVDGRAVSMTTEGLERSE